MMHQPDILQEIYKERLRQESLKRQGKFTYTCADAEMCASDKLAVLGEEFGECAKEVTEIIIARQKLRQTKDPTWNQALTARKRALRKELIQVAAVCMAWVESIDAGHSDEAVIDPIIAAFKAL